jgi:hypothetical protein
MTVRRRPATRAEARPLRFSTVASRPLYARSAQPRAGHRIGLTGRGVQNRAWSRGRGQGINQSSTFAPAINIEARRFKCSGAKRSSEWYAFATRGDWHRRTLALLAEASMRTDRCPPSVSPWKSRCSFANRHGDAASWNRVCPRPANHGGRAASLLRPSYCRGSLVACRRLRARHPSPLHGRPQLRLAPLLPRFASSPWLPVDAPAPHGPSRAPHDAGRGPPALLPPIA